MKITIHNEIIDKAKTKKDGVYSHKGYLYTVKNNNFISYADSFGYVFIVQGMFHSNIGKVEIHDRRKVLLTHLI